MIVLAFVTVLVFIGWLFGVPTDPYNDKTSSKRIVEIIKALRDSDEFIEDIYTRGSCFKFYEFLAVLFGPENVEPYFSLDKAHVVAKIDGRLYDIRGMIDRKYETNYAPMLPSEIEEARHWSFSGNYLLQLTECPHCDEPITFPSYNYKIKKS